VNCGMFDFSNILLIRAYLRVLDITSFFHSFL
jgi:hypothetical protein